LRRQRARSLLATIGIRGFAPLPWLKHDKEEAAQSREQKAEAARLDVVEAQGSALRSGLRRTLNPYLCLADYLVAGRGDGLQSPGDAAVVLRKRIIIK
jgi:hypothetical protein